MLGNILLAHWSIEDQHSGLVIPEDWPHIQAFVDWYMLSKKPIMIPHDAEVIHIENATSIPLFRRGKFQVELYIVFPGHDIPSHSHPGVDIVTVILGGGGVCGGPHPIYGTGESTGRCMLTPDGKKHNAPTRLGGYALLSFEHWKNREPTSAAKNWDGVDIGPEHAKIREAL